MPQGRVDTRACRPAPEAALGQGSVVRVPPEQAWQAATSKYQQLLAACNALRGKFPLSRWNEDDKGMPLRVRECYIHKQLHLFPYGHAVPENPLTAPPTYQNKKTQQPQITR